MRQAGPAHGERGAVVIETALVAGMILTCLLFSVQIGVLGFLQVTSDAASFVDAHLHSVGLQPNSPQTAEGATVNAFTQLAPGDISSTPLPAPSASIPVDYRYNGSSNEQTYSQTTRVGGTSMMQPALTQSQVTPHQTLDLFGNNVGVKALDTEPQWKECGVHYNVANLTNLSCGGAADNNFQVDYFQSGENTPPYFVGFNYLQHCDNVQPWKTCGGSPGVDFISFGMGEFLYAKNSSETEGGNWQRVNPGISGAKDTSTFQETACHQRAFSQLAAFFANYTDLYQIYMAFGGTPSASNTIMHALFTTHPNDFSTWSEFEGAGGATGLAADQAIQQVYSWDERVQAGYNYNQQSQPGTYRPSPDNGC